MTPTTQASRPCEVMALSGGVGGAKMAQALMEVLGGNTPTGEAKQQDRSLARDDAQTPALCVVCNTADDFEHLNLHISPDLDSVMYRLADLHDDERGWGRRDETWAFLEALREIGGPTWFQLGDRDLAVHVERTRRLRGGATLSEVTRELCEHLRISAAVVPMSDDPVRTVVCTSEGELDFQHYFVRERCAPEVVSFRFDGCEQASASPAFVSALASDTLNLIVLCPSNPFVSIDPILALPGVCQRVVELRESGVPVVAISPILGGQALKGPAAKMLRELGHEVSAVGVARYYAERDLISHFLVDPVDQELAPRIEALGVEVVVHPALLTTLEQRRALAECVLGFTRH